MHQEFRALVSWACDIVLPELQVGVTSGAVESGLGGDEGVNTHERDIAIHNLE